MKKVVYFLSSAIVAMFAFTGCGSDDDESSTVISMDASNNVISKIENSYLFDYVYLTSSDSFEYENGKLSSITNIDEDKHSYTTILGWENNNITSYNGNEQFIYSDIKNNTNIDFALWFREESFIYTSQFIKTISNNIPSSYKSSYSGVAVITTSLDEKGRPSKMVFDGYTYTFEYYD